MCVCNVNINNFTAVCAKYVHFTLHLLCCLLVHPDTSSKHCANGYFVIIIERIILKLDMAIDHKMSYPKIYLVLLYLQH